MRSFAKWLENWLKNGSASFRFSKQTMQALIWTLRSQADLLDELLIDDHKYILTARLQSDPIERRFSQYRQLNGGHFLVSLREVETSEKILLCQTLLKENINFWEEELAVTNTTQEIEKFKEALDSMSVLIQEATLTAETEEVVQVVSGYIAKQLTEKTKCCHVSTHYVAVKLKRIRTLNFYRVGDSKYDLQFSKIMLLLVLPL